MMPLLYAGLDTAPRTAIPQMGNHRAQRALVSGRDWLEQGCSSPEGLAVVAANGKTQAGAAAMPLFAPPHCAHRAVTRPFDDFKVAGITTPRPRRHGWSYTSSTVSMIECSPRAPVLRRIASERDRAQGIIKFEPPPYLRDAGTVSVAAFFGRVRISISAPSSRSSSAWQRPANGRRT